MNFASHSTEESSGASNVTVNFYKDNIPSSQQILPRIQFQVFFSYLFDGRYGDILFEVVSLSIMQKVFPQFSTIYSFPNVALMVVESNVAFSLCTVDCIFCILSRKLPMLNDSLVCGIS